MGRLIDIDRLCNDLAKRWSIADKKKEDLIRAVMADVVTPIVVSQPTVDAVEVVRCKDCKFVGTDATCCLVCEREGMGLRPFHVYHEDFCSRGERKDGEHDRG